jgi:hypothetical protein
MNDRAAVASEAEASRLGMDRPIDRRDFIQDVAAGSVMRGAGIGFVSPAPAASLAPTADVYPSLRTGLRGQYPGSFETAHATRDGDLGGEVRGADSGEHYDLVVVGGGISGLAAAWFYRKALGDESKILILDNHDDFGGHAKRRTTFSRSPSTAGRTDMRTPTIPWAMAMFPMRSCRTSSDAGHLAASPTRTRAQRHSRMSPSTRRTAP